MCQLSPTILIASFHLLNWTWDSLGYFPRPFLKTGVTLATSHSFEIQQFTDLSSRLYPIATSRTASYPNSFRTEYKSHLLLVVSHYPFHQSVIKSLPLTLLLESVPHSTLQWADPLQEFCCSPLQWTLMQRINLFSAVFSTLCPKCLLRSARLRPSGMLENIFLDIIFQHFSPSKSFCGFIFILSFMFFSPLLHGCNFGWCNLHAQISL